MMYDVIVIGGGPCGSVAAKEAVSHNLKTLLIDRKKHIGRPVRCTGLLSKRTVKDLKISQNSILNKIKGANIYSPDNKRITIDAEETKAYVVDREAFDKELLLKAKEAGVEVWLETEAINIDGKMIKVNHKGKERQLKTNVFIGAYGAKYSKNNSLANFPSPQKILYGLQTIVPYTPNNKNFVELFFGSNYSDCFFAWAVPIDKKSAKVGLTCSSFLRARKGLKNLLEHLKCKLKKNPTAGIIPIGPPKMTVNRNMLICGDAAAHAKPTSGGGVYTGTLCARIAAETVAQYLEGRGLLTEYEKKWREKIEKELQIGMISHKILTRLSDTYLNKISIILSQSSSIELIKKVGDIDYPSLLIKQILSAPLKLRKILLSFSDSLL
jgi:digeranylgeranylglycerophospholipid reductase